MPLRDDLLNPIPGDNPGGQNLRGSDIYIKIEEARREDDDLAAGDWARARKTADWATVIKLASEALATKSKDLQLAVWLVEGLLKREGWSGFRQGMVFLQQLLNEFWDQLYPPLLEEGDYDEHPAEMRSVPIQFITDKFGHFLRFAPLTKNGMGFYKMKDAQAVGSQEDADNDSSGKKQELREDAIKQGRPTMEDWEAAVKGTQLTFYEQSLADVDKVIELLGELRSDGEERFGFAAPNYNRLKEDLQGELRHTIYQLFVKKGGKAPGEEEPEPDQDSSDDGWGSSDESGTESESSSSDDSWGDSGGTATAVARAPVRKSNRKIAGLEPADTEEAELRLAAIGTFLRGQDMSNPNSYLMALGYRWGELRQVADSPDYAFLAAPDQDTRQNLKRAASESDWETVLRSAGDAMAQPCGRAWLDLVRYAYRAAENMGYEKLMQALASETRALLSDIPDLPKWTLADDTPTANAETQEWIAQVAAPVASVPSLPPPSTSSWGDEEETSSSNGEDAAEHKISAFELALTAARSGRQQEALEILARELSNQPSGRGRFQTKLQLAEICMAIHREEIAFSLLEELALVIEKHQLEQWEAPELMARPLTLLLHCSRRLERDPAEKDRLLARICRLDPVQALACLS